MSDQQRTTDWNQTVANSIALNAVPSQEILFTKDASQDLAPGSDHLVVEVKSQGSALEPDTYIFMQSARRSEAYLHYVRHVKDPDELKQTLERHLEIERRLLDRTEKSSRRKVSKDSDKKVKFVLEEFEKLHIHDIVSASCNRDKTFRPKSQELAALVEPLGGYSHDVYKRIVSKYIENHRNAILEATRTGACENLADYLM